MRWQQRSTPHRRPRSLRRRSIVDARARTRRRKRPRRGRSPPSTAPRSARRLQTATAGPHRGTRTRRAAQARRTRQDGTRLASATSSPDRADTRAQTRGRRVRSRGACVPTRKRVARRARSQPLARRAARLRSAKPTKVERTGRAADRRGRRVGKLGRRRGSSRVADARARSTRRPAPCCRGRSVRSRTRRRAGSRAPRSRPRTR